MPNLASPAAKYRSELLRYLSRPFKNLSDAQKFWIGFAVLVLLTTLLIANPFSRAAGDTYQEGDIVRQDLVSPADINITDESNTESLRQSARDAVLPIFTFESDRSEEAVNNFRSSWQSMLSAVSRKTDSAANAKSANVNAKGERLWALESGEDVTKVFLARKFSQSEIESATAALRESSGGWIYADHDQKNFQGDFTLVDRQRPNQQSVVQFMQGKMASLSAARAKLREKIANIPSLSVKEVDAFNAAASPFIQPSLAFDSAATTAAREDAAKAVAPITVSLKRSETVARQGELVTANTLAKLSAIQSYTNTSRQLNRFLGVLALITGLFWGAWKYIEHRGTMARFVLTPERTFALFGFVALVQTALMNICFQLADFTAVQMMRAPFKDPTLWSLAIPFAFASLVMTLLADRPVALFTGLFSSLIAGFLAPKGLEFVIFAAIASITAVYGIGRYRTRQSVTIAGFLVGGISALAAIALIGYLQLPFILNTVLLAVACGIVGGVITSAFTSIFLPICESLFGILTDVKLLELSNADLPVLGQVALRSPGTNQHSHAVGHLAEEASRAVGANPLLARIGSLYHDIGKVASPEHFVENQLGKNPHDRLKPVQSAKIIISHVSYGIKLGKEIGLPQRIIDFIPQHHGTRTLHYFLRKAQAEASNPEEVDESDFRYPGPKPQFKEAAIMMIADSCEAAARSLAQPTPENIRFIVTKIIDAILSDDQLDECDLTLRELTVIRESMIKSLVAIYHSRIDYPGYIPPNSMPKIPLPAAEEDAEERGIKYTNPADIPISRGGEIEDEAIDRSHEPISEKAEAKAVK
jgi:hypothetical protein